MKELLSIEEKAKAYDEAIERARKIKNGEPINVPDGTPIPVAIFPELIESDDEKMRAMAIKAVHAPEAQSCIKSWGVNPQDVIDWLEKQGEQKPSLDAEIPFGAKDSDLQEATYFIPNGFHAEIEGDKVVIKKGEQKSAEWSDEDEEIYRRCICSMRASACGFPEEEKFVEKVDNWLKSLKDRVQPKQEWSDEDEKTIHLACEFIRHHSRPIDSIGGIDCSALIERLKSIKEKCAFNLSDEQIEALSAMVKYCDIATSFNAHKQRIVESLYQALKKLRKE